MTSDGTPIAPRRRCARVAIAAAIAIAASTLPLAEANAQDICTGLKQALRHAAGNFAALKTSSKPPSLVAGPGVNRIFAARSLFSGGSDCAVIEERTGFRYTCKLGAGAPAKATREDFVANAAQVERCFPDLTPRRIGNPLNEKRSTAAVVWQGRTGVHFDLQLAISGIGDIRDNHWRVVVSRERK